MTHKNTTLIRIDTSTRKKLSALGNHGDSFDSIINKLLEGKK